MENGYNSNISARLGGIAYDRKIYETVGEYIRDNIWDRMDENMIKDISDYMIDQKSFYDEEDAYLDIYKKYIPEIKKIMDKQGQLPLKTLSFPPHYIDKLISQQVRLCKSIDQTNLAVSRALVMGTEEELAQDKKTRTRTITPLAKTIMANILTLLVMQEQEDTKKKIIPRKVIHMRRKTTKQGKKYI